MCEKCWGDAYMRMMLRGGEQADHYQDLLAERTGWMTCTPEQQQGDRRDGSEPEEVSRADD